MGKLGGGGRSRLYSEKQEEEGRVEGGVGKEEKEGGGGLVRRGRVEGGVGKEDEENGGRCW